MTPGAYLLQQRVKARLSIEGLALRLSTDPELSLLRRIAWIRTIESDVAPISAFNAAAYLSAVHLDLEALGHVVGLIRQQSGVDRQSVEPIAAGINLAVSHDRTSVDA